eukprot:gene26682-4257_t
MSALLEKLGIKEKTRTASEVIKKLVVHLGVLESSAKEKDREKALESIPKYLAQLKGLILGGDAIGKEEVLAIAHEACSTELLLMLVKRLVSLEFEARKDVAAIFSCIVRIRDDATDKSPGASYILSRTTILDLLFQGYDEPSIALNSGSMLRDCIRDETIAKVVLDSPIATAFFCKVEVSNFEISSDAFSTFKDLMSRHKAVVSNYLQQNYSEFFPAYVKLLQSSNYVTRRLSLKLLGEILLGRSNVKVMVRFVSEPAYLMQMMMLLKDESPNIQFEAYHVFKVFVCNPAKPQAITDILANNRDKLLKYLEEFQTERDIDEQFKEEKALIIKEISINLPRQIHRENLTSVSCLDAAT